MRTQSPLLLEAVRFDEQDPIIQANLGLAYKGAGQYDKAIDLLSGCMSRPPPDIRPAVALNAAICELDDADSRRDVMLLVAASDSFIVKVQFLGIH